MSACLATSGCFASRPRMIILDDVPPNLSRQATSSNFFHRLVFSVSKPDTHGDLSGEPDEPRIPIICGRPGLASRPDPRSGRRSCSLLYYTLQHNAHCLGHLSAQNTPPLLLPGHSLSHIVFYASDRIWNC